MILWIKTTRDKYELPIAVADSAKEFADMLGITLSAICRAYKKGKTVFKVEIEEGDNSYEDG